MGIRSTLSSKLYIDGTNGGKEVQRAKTEAPVWALGAMSGTSLDGVDAALLLTDGERIFEFGDTAFRPYSERERATLRAALGRWPEDDVAEAAEIVETAHAELLSKFPKAEIVGFHGQTLAHDPRGRGTHQVGDGGVLTEVLGREVVWDFRSADVELGGEGAPLAPIYHFACAQWIGATTPIAFLNLGGVGNLTWIDPLALGPDDPHAMLAFDTGPANAPIDDLMATRRGVPRDEDGALARAGMPDGAVLEAYLRAPYFLRIPPKSLDRQDFSALSEGVATLSDADAAATLTEAVALAVEAALVHVPMPPERLLVTGGGRKNPAIMAALGRRTGRPVDPVEAVGLDGDMLEAQAFAYLAVRVARGFPTTFRTTTGVSAAVSGGRISRPGQAAMLTA